MTARRPRHEATRMESVSRETDSRSHITFHVKPARPLASPGLVPILVALAHIGSAPAQVAPTNIIVSPFTTIAYRLRNHGPCCRNCQPKGWRWEGQDCC